MDFYAPLCKHVVIPLWAKWERSSYLNNLEYLLTSQYFDWDRIQSYQLKSLKTLLNHAATHSPFYRKLFKEHGVNPSKIDNFDDFRNIPILSKTDVINNKMEMIVPTIPKYSTFLTSGSTGKPLSGFWDKECADWKRGCAVRSTMWGGYQLGDPIYCLYGDPEKEKTGIAKLRSKMRRTFLARTEVLDLLSLCPQSMLSFANKMRCISPSILWGHAHALFTLAKFYDQNNILDIQPKGMFSAGMVLHNWERKLIQKVFNCTLHDRYGCEELGLIATECEHQKGLHINTDSHYVEVVDKNGKSVPNGQPGYIIITDLTNKIMPFIRYKLEDIVTLSSEVCSCGRQQPLISKIEGRVADFLITPEGKLVSGISLTDHFAGQIIGAAQVQIIQEKIDLLKINIVTDNLFTSETEEQIKILVEDFFGSYMKHHLNYIDEIPKEDSGKFRFTINKVKHELL